MSIWERIKLDPKQDLYFEFKYLFDIIETRRLTNQLGRRVRGKIPIQWYEDEREEMRKK
ncbi:hypothetical protein LCGC14_0507290 [marine sediment metagenome]|uniref:Uncharacterized protein n=1 Tax=marine sediment metagenome TaxID=412755 RepID=A0A0F9UNV0_9ZZZZ